MELQSVELPAPVGRVEAGGQPDGRARRERQRRLDVARRRRPALLPLGPNVEGVGDPDAVDGPEPRHQQRERVHRPVVQRADLEERVRAVVPVGDAADVGVRVPQPHRAEPAVGEEPARAALGGRPRRPGRTAEREAAVAGERDEVSGLGGVERERLLRVDVAVGLERGPCHRRVGGVARQVHDERRVDALQRRLQVGERRAAVVRGERRGALLVEVDDAGERQRTPGQPGGVLRRDRPRPDEQTVHGRTVGARRIGVPAVAVEGFAFSPAGAVLSPRANARS